MHVVTYRQHHAVNHNQVNQCTQSFTYLTPLWMQVFISIMNGLGVGTQPKHVHVLNAKPLHPTFSLDIN